MSRSTLRPGDHVALTAEKPAAGGRMLARTEQGIVLVSGVLPGERVTAQVERVGKGVVFARAEHIHEPSIDRREPSGDPACGGLAFAHVAYPRQLRLKGEIIADALVRIARVPCPAPIPVDGGAERGYRLRARLHVHGSRVGFLREGTHLVCDPRPGGQLRDDTVDLLDRLGEQLAGLGMSQVRALELAEDVPARTRVVALDADAPVDTGRLRALTSIDGLTGLVCVSPGRVQVVDGTPWVSDVLTREGGTDVAVRRHVLSFFQGNRYLLQPFVEAVTDLLPEGGRLLDLYAGGGLFSLAAAAWRRARVTAVEGDHSGADDLADNAASTGGAVRPVAQPVESFLERAPRAFDAVVIDPPRTGMSPEAITGLLRLAPPVIVSVSCDPATFARDTRLLLAAGYTLGDVRGFDLFPNTPHVETLARFTR